MKSPEQGRSKPGTPALKSFPKSSSWLETNIEVVAKDPESQIIEKLPLRLDAADLATYCHRVMGDFREDRAYLHSQVTLEFQYKEAA